MNAPTNPATNPFGACLRIASLSASVFPRAAIHAFPNTGPAYQMPPITKLRIVDAITAIKKLPSNMIAMSLPPRRRSSRRGYNFSATFMHGRPVTRSIRRPCSRMAKLSSASGPYVDSNGARNGPGCRSGPRGGRGGARLRRGGSLRSLREEIANHGCVRIHQSSREAALSQADHIGLLQASADVELEVQPLERLEEKGIGPELGPESAQIDHADGREADRSETVQHLGEIGGTLASASPHDFAVPVDAREDVRREGVEPGERVDGGQRLRPRDDPFHIEHVAVHDLLGLTAARVEPDVAPLHQMARDLEIRIRSIDAGQVEQKDACRVVPRSANRVPVLLERRPVRGRIQSAVLPTNARDGGDADGQMLEDPQGDQRVGLDREDRNREDSLLRGARLRGPQPLLLPLELRPCVLRIEENGKSLVAARPADERAAVAIDPRDRPHHEELRMDLPATATAACGKVLRSETAYHGGPQSTRMTFTRLPIQSGGRYTRPELPLFATTFSTIS